MPESVILLLSRAKERLAKEQPNSPFLQSVESLVSYLRQKGVLSEKHLSRVGHWHTTLAAAFVIADEHGISFALPTRSQQVLYDLGGSTRLVSWLDKAVVRGVLLSGDPLNTARGPLHLSDTTKAVIAQVEPEIA
jgi:hypothetical protein